MVNLQTIGEVADSGSVRGVVSVRDDYHVVATVDEFLSMSRDIRMEYNIALGSINNLECHIT